MRILIVSTSRYKIKVGRSRSFSGPFLDRNGTDLVNGGGDVILGSHGWLYGPGGQGVLDDGNKDILYYHYGMCFLLISGRYG